MRGGCFGVGGCDIAALCTALNQLLWFVRLRSDKHASCRWTAKILVSNGKIDNRLGVEHLHMRFASRTGAALMAGGFLLISAISASAQSQGSGPPAAGEQKPPDQAQGEQKPPDQATAEQQAEARALEEIEQYKQAAVRLSLSAGSAECVWTGRRIESLLWRDDVDTARRYIDLYDRFGCSAEHLKLAFRCIIRQGPIDPKAADRLAARVQSCWIDPDGPTTAASSAAKSGTIPN
jgi:hypothetical protein